MTLSKRLLVTVLIGTLAAAAALAWFRTAPTGKGSAATQARTESNSGQADPLIELNEADLLTIATGRLVRSLPVTGTITAASQTLVRARVSGDIIDIPVREGMSVKAGQLIARIDPADFELRLSERTAQLRSAQAQLEQARRTLENNARLLDKAFISQNAYDNSRFAVDGARAAVEAADAQLAQARKALADT
ncbi:MAG: efflux RND transporter periplasmic adaptor subunit, partial [Betaproteobacteria bacterium]|nr:efflux RND transporter periplasmic adaptor subunit [Betaproteobacteria bacterium]